MKSHVLIVDRHQGMFDLRQFAALAPDWYLRLAYHQDLVSTNDEARKLALEGAEHGTVVLSEYQTAGRGRRGAEWICEAGDGLLFSMIVRPTFPKEHWSRIALASGLGIAEALHEICGVHAKVKWPNDVYIQNKKCAGILAEAREDFVVVGVGINVVSAPVSTSPGIGAISVAEAASNPVSREVVFSALLNGIFSEVESCGNQFDEQLPRLQKKCYLTGSFIRFTAHEKQLEGTVHGIGSDGSLKVEVDGEHRRFSQAADIVVL